MTTGLVVARDLDKYERKFDVISRSREEWLPVVGYEGFYEISSFGLVKSLPRIVEGRWGTCSLTGRVLCPQKEPHAYVVRLSKNGGTRPFQVHRLVLEAFVGPCPNGMQCCHWDGNPHNNVLTNLRWDTAKANMADRTRHGRTWHPIGEKNGACKLTEEDVNRIRAIYVPRQCTMKRIAKEYGVSVSMIHLVVHRKNWSNI